MTYKEFETRAMAVSNEEFEHIHAVYMESDLDKDEFCKVWCKMNARRVKMYKAAQAAKEAAERLRDKLANIAMKIRFSGRWDCIADNELSESEKRTLAEVGISIEEKQAVPYWTNEGLNYLPMFKVNRTICHEIESYLGIKSNI